MIRRTTRAMTPRPTRLRKKVSPPVPVSSGPATSRVDRYRNRSPLVPLDEADDADRRSLELDESVLDAHTHLLGFVNAVGKQVYRPAPDALRPGTDTATENAGLGVGARRSSARVLFLGSC